MFQAADNKIETSCITSHERVRQMAESKSKSSDFLEDMFTQREEYVHNVTSTQKVFPQNMKLTVFDPDIPETPIYRAKTFPPSIPVNRDPTDQKIIQVPYWLITSHVAEITDCDWLFTCYYYFLVFLIQTSICDQEPTDTSKQPIRTRYLGHVTSYQPIRDQYFLIRSVHALPTFEIHVQSDPDLPGCSGERFLPGKSGFPVYRGQILLISYFGGRLSSVSLMCLFCFVSKLYNLIEGRKGPYSYEEPLYQELREGFFHEEDQCGDTLTENSVFRSCDTNSRLVPGHNPDSVGFWLLLVEPSLKATPASFWQQ
eukprot:sb/3467032/